MCSSTQDYVAQLLDPAGKRRTSMVAASIEGKRRVGDFIIDALVALLLLGTKKGLEDALRMVNNLAATNPAATLRRNSVVVALSHGDVKDKVSLSPESLGNFLQLALDGWVHLQTLDEVAAVIPPDPAKLLELLGWDPSQSLEGPVDQRRYHSIVTAYSFKSGARAWESEVFSKKLARFDSLVQNAIGCLPGSIEEPADVVLLPKSA